MRRVEKPWGHELIWADTDLYVGKVLHVKAGHALSLQYHERKDETIHLWRGAMKFWVGPSADALELVELNEGLAEYFQAEAGDVETRFEEAWKNADVKITSPCFCQPGV